VRLVDHTELIETTEPVPIFNHTERAGFAHRPDKATPKNPEHYRETPDRTTSARTHSPNHTNPRGNTPPLHNKPKPNEYKNLAKNTVSLAIGQFASKLLVYFMIYFYTLWLGKDGFGEVSNIVNICALLIVGVTLSIGDGINRYALDKTGTYDKKGVFTNALIVCLSGNAVFFVLSFFIGLFGENIAQYRLLIVFYVLVGSIKSCVALFVRSSGHVRLYAVDGIVTTAANIAFNILFLGILGLSVKGYIMSVVLGDLCSILFLTFSAKVYRSIDFKAGRWFFGKMLKFSLPYVPTAVMIWIINLSDGLIITAKMSAADNGVYQAAYKFPALIALAAGIFTQAFNISAIGGENTEPSPKRNKFFTEVFNAYTSFIFFASCGLLLIIRPLLLKMTAPGFEYAYRVTPFLILGSVFTCFGQFLGTVYAAEEKSVSSMITAASGAAMNLLLNFALIPIFGLQGAAFATCVSYALIFAVRFKDTKKYVTIDVKSARFGVQCGCALLMGCVIIFFHGSGMYYPLLIALFLVSGLICGREVMNMGRRILRR
jgi:O-antigen/teichoic acid export membrane protein